MPKLRGCLTHLCSYVDCTQLIHSLRMMYLADEQHNCAKKEKFQPCKHMEASSALNNLVKMVMIILFAWYFKKAFTFLKDSSNDLPTMISTFLLL